ncbi:MAG: hypothetical protein AABX16_03550, partial [Nanoarchaeota archaeon]
MKKEVLIVLSLLVSMQFIFAATITVPTDFTTIQDAIDAASDGGIIEVSSSASPYVEDIIINKNNLEIHSAVGEIVIIKGVATVLSASFPLAAPNIEIVGDDVSLHGFTIESPDYIVSRYSSGIVIGGKNTKIYNNSFLINAVDSLDDISQAIQTYASTALPGVDISGLSIYNNSFHHKGSGDWGYEGIYINIDEGLGSISLRDNRFTGNILRAITSERNSVVIQNNVIITDAVASDLSSFGSFQGINIRRFDGGLQKDILVEDNVIRGVSPGMGFYQGVRLGQTGQTFLNVSTNNNFIQYNTKGVLTKIDAGAVINYNTIMDNTFGVTNDGAGTLNATYNYWGSCDGPSGAGPGSGDITSAGVDFDPWLGICITNKINVSCAFENTNITLRADVNGSFFDSMWFSYTINGANFNKTGSLSLGSFINYFYTINLSAIGGQNISWNVYVNDSFGNIFSNGLKTFYIHNSTRLIINPSSPEGLNGWYVNEPFFILTNDTHAKKRYYRWDSANELEYIAPFGLENIPNQPKNSSGILELNYWSEFFCGNETVHDQIFKIDLTSPLIKNLMPANKSTVYNNLRPTIQAFLDEVYGSNSGINKNKTYMRLDNTLVLSTILGSGLIDATIRHNPLTDLSEGKHNVSIYVEDNAGRNNTLNWSFIINTSAALFNLTVYTPANGSFGTKRISFNITTTKVV